MTTTANVEEQTWAVSHIGATFPLYHEARKGLCFNVMIKCDNYMEKERGSEREKTERERQ